MLYSLCQNVYLVKGNVNDCLYDFNSLKLYHINRKLTNLIERCIGQAIMSLVLNNAEKMILTKMMLANLIESTNVIASNNIYELANKDKNIDFAWIEVTTKCNLRCIHCYDNSSYDRDEELSFREFKAIIHELRLNNVNKIQIIGGEPFCLADKIRNMFDHAVGKFDSIEVFTNGTLLNEKWIKYFKQNNIKVALSVYSYNESIHDRVTTKPGSCKMTNSTIALLAKYDVKYRVCNVVMSGVDIGLKNTNLYELNSSKDIVRMAGRADLSLLSNELIRKKIITKDSFAAPSTRTLTNRLLRGHNCFSSKIYIAANLDVFPCVMERRVKHGNLKDSSLSKLRNEDILNLSKDRIEGCKFCEFRFTCFDCRSNSLSSDVYSKPWYCTYDPINGVWADVNEFIITLKQ